MRLLILVLLVVAALSAAIALHSMARRRQERDRLAQRRRACPSCGKAALWYSDEEKLIGSGESVGQGTTITTAHCGDCGFESSWDRGWEPRWYRRANQPASRVEGADSLLVTFDPPAGNGSLFRLRVEIDSLAPGQEFHWWAVPFKGVAFVVAGRRHIAGEGEIKTEIAEIESELPAGEAEVFVSTWAAGGPRYGSLKLSVPAPRTMSNAE